jgi:hypothetical protein
MRSDVRSNKLECVSTLRVLNACQMPQIEDMETKRAKNRVSRVCAIISYQTKFDVLSSTCIACTNMIKCLVTQNHR